MKKLFVLLALLPSFAFADLNNDFKKSELELNKSYQLTLDKIDNPLTKQKFIDNQKLWFSYSRGFCSLTDGHPTIEETKLCLIPLIEYRTKQIKTTLCKSDGYEAPFCAAYD